MNEFEAYEILKPMLPEWLSLMGAREYDLFYGFVFHNINSKSAGCCYTVYKDSGNVLQRSFIGMQGSRPIRKIDISTLEPD